MKKKYGYKVIKGRILEEKEVVKEDDYPYLVIRYMPSVYNRVRIVFVSSDKKKPIPDTLTLVEPKPFDSQGGLTEQCRKNLIKVVKYEAKKKGLRLCIVFGARDAVYCEPDGAVKESVDPPSGGISCLRFPI